MDVNFSLEPYGLIQLCLLAMIVYTLGTRTFDGRAYENGLYAHMCSSD